MIDAVREAGFKPLGADVVELAPDLAPDRAGRLRSMETAAAYLRSELLFLRGSGEPGAATG